MHHLATVFVVFLIWASPVFSGCLDEIGSLPVGPASAVEAVETKAFVGNGPRLSLIDISEPGAPVMTSEVVFQGVVSAIEAAGEVVFVVTGMSDVWVVDFSDPDRPDRAHVYSRPEYSIVDLESDGNMLYVAGYRWLPNEALSFLHILDVQDPGQPVELGTLERSAAFGKMLLSEGLLFITDGWRDSLVILDVTTPHNPLFLAEHRHHSHPGEIAISGEHVFVPTSTGWVHSIDISDPANPRLVASLGDFGSYYNRIEIIDGLAFVTTWHGRMELIDISDPTDLSHIATVPLEGIPRDLSLSGERLFIACEGAGMQEFSVAIPEDPVQIGVFETPGELLDVAVSSHFLYTAELQSSTRVLDVSDPAKPVVIEQASPLPQGRLIKRAGDLLFLANDFIFQILDISEPAHPILISEIETGRISDFTVVENMLYLATSMSRIVMFDISDPHHPLELAQVDVPVSSISKIQVRDGFAFTADPGCVFGFCPPRLVIMDTSDPSAATLSSMMDIWFASGFEIFGDYAYSDHYIVDISDPEEPFLVSTFELEEPGWSVAADYRLGYDYVTTTEGIFAVNVRNPSNPNTRAMVELNARPWNTVASGGLLYVANGFAGLKILQDCSARPMENLQEFTTQ